MMRKQKIKVIHFRKEKQIGITLLRLTKKNERFIPSIF